MKKRLYSFIVLIHLCLFARYPLSLAQETATPVGYETVIIRAPIVPEQEGHIYFSFHDQVAIIFEDIVDKLDLGGLGVAIWVDPATAAQQPSFVKDNILGYEQLSDYVEVVVISDATIHQQAVRPEQAQPQSVKELLFDQDASTVDEPYPDNIQTLVSLEADFYEIEEDQYLGSMFIEVEHTGGNRAESEAAALKKLAEKVTLEFKRIYWLSGDIISAEDGTLTLNFGKNHGVRKNFKLEIVEPDRIVTEGENEMLIDGAVVGLAAVTDVGEDSCQAKVMRLWRDHQPGSWVVERPGSRFALQLNIMPPLIVDYANYSLHFHAAPMRAFDWGGGLSFIRVKDSQDRNDYGFGFSGFTLYRFVNGPRFDWGAKLGFDLDIPFRKDDEENVVSTALFSLYLGLNAEVLLSRKTDLIFCAGYRLGLKNDHWDYSVDEESYPAYWLDQAPEVENSGFVFSIGYKYIFLIPSIF
ncbi:hypothetical protein JXO59_11810 [candidate division KSB1 bacterium]|nr:hypothetical protein [candidate division KSB1 bacterium]